MTANRNIDKEFIRWQNITITQLSYSINLILTFSVGAIGFTASLLLSKNFETNFYLTNIFLFSLALLSLSVALGIWCTINRLRDFRATARITNLKRKNNHDDSELSSLRKLTHKLGKITWKIFWWQIGTFSGGIFILVLSVAFSVKSV